MWQRWPICDRVIVNLVDGRAFAGVLYAKRGPLLVLREATMHEPGAESVQLDGEVIIERPQVAFIQVRT